MNATQIDIATTLEQLDPLLVRRVRYLLRGRRADQIDDATQEVRLVLWRALAKYDPARGPVEPFAQRVVDNAARDQQRRLRTRPAHFDLLDGDVPAEPEADALGPSPELLDAARDQLPPALARLLDALRTSPTPGAAADRLGLKPESVYRMTARLKERIRSMPVKVTAPAA